MFRIAVVAHLVAYAAAVSLTCQNTLIGIAGNSDASSCLAISLLIPIITARETSIVEPLNKWLGSMCSAERCSNATLTAVVTNLTASCSGSTDLNISTDATSLLSSVKSLYPTVREILCLKHGPTLCVTETLTNVETVTGPLSLTAIGNIYEKPPTSFPTNITCTDCNKATYNVWAKAVPSTVSDAKPVLESQCGASFVDGSTPSGISQSANTGISATSTGSAFSLLDTLTNRVIMAIGASGVIALSTVYTLLF